MYMHGKNRETTTSIDDDDEHGNGNENENEDMDKGYELIRDVGILMIFSLVRLSPPLT